MGIFGARCPKTLFMADSSGRTVWTVPGPLGQCGPSGRCWDGRGVSGLRLCVRFVKFELRLLIVSQLFVSLQKFPTIVGKELVSVERTWSIR